MKKRKYIKPELTIYPLLYNRHLLSASPGNKDVTDDPWDGNWDGKETDFDDDDNGGYNGFNPSWNNVNPFSNFDENE